MTTPTINSCSPVIKTATVLELIADTDSPVTAFNKVSRIVSPGFLFESAYSRNESSRFSILGVDPIESICVKDGQVELIDHGSGKSCLVQVPDLLAFIDQRLQIKKQELRCDTIPDFLPFKAGYAGYLGYGVTSYLDGIKKQSVRAADVPDLYLGFYDSSIIFDHLYRRLYIISFRSPEHAGKLYQLLQESVQLPRLPHTVTISKSLKETFQNTTSSLSYEEFISRVLECKEQIKAGQVFQIVLSQRFSLPVKVDSFSIYRILQSFNPSPYGYFLKFPNFSYLGASPETLLTVRNKNLSLKALAGTCKRGQSEEEDLLLEKAMKSSKKEMAEHMMLVDLGRNDLGAVAYPDTVSTGEVASVVRYQHVMHLSTEIKAKLENHKSSFDAIRSCFPAGTVSGAPKIRAMQLLSELEPEARGIYSGMVGYFDISGNCDGAIAIRSALVKDGMAHVNAGAGIVYDSIPEDEYEETRNKAYSVITAVKLAEYLMELQP